MLRYQKSRVFVLVAILSITLWCTVQDAGATYGDQKASTSRTKNTGDSFDEAEFQPAPSSFSSPTHVSENLESNEDRSVVPANERREIEEENRNENEDDDEEDLDEEDEDEDEDNEYADGKKLPGRSNRKTFREKYDNLTKYTLETWRAPHRSKEFEITVKQESIFDDSFQQLKKQDARLCLVRHMKIHFEEDNTPDEGGLTRKWFYLLSKEIFNPSRGLFQFVDASKSDALRINPKSGENNQNHLRHFEFVGRFIGLAIYYGRRVRVNLIRPFYKRILNKRIEIKDTNKLIKLDSQFRKYVKKIKNQPRTSQPISFTTQEGDHILPKTENETKEFLRVVTDWEYVSKVEEQMSALIKGLNQVIPLYLLRDNFNEEELEQLFSDTDDLDIIAWQKHTKYGKPHKKSDGIIEIFWETIRNYNESQRRKIFQYVTGTDAISVVGTFDNMRPPFKITEPKWGVTTSLRADINKRQLIFSHQMAGVSLRRQLNEIAGVSSQNQP